MPAKSKATPTAAATSSNLLRNPYEKQRQTEGGNSVNDNGRSPLHSTTLHNQPRPQLTRTSSQQFPRHHHHHKINPPLFPLQSIQEVVLFNVWGLFVVLFGLMMVLADVFQSYRPVFPLLPLIITSFLCAYSSVAVLGKFSVRRYGDKNFSYFQPFVGGDTYVAMQCLGHTAIAASLLTASLMWHLVYRHHTTYPHGPLARHAIDGDGNETTFYVQDFNKYCILSVCGVVGAMGSFMLMRSISYYRIPPRDSCGVADSTNTTPLIASTPFSTPYLRTPSSTLTTPGVGGEGAVWDSSGGIRPSHRSRYTAWLRLSPLREMVLIGLLSLGGSSLAALISLDPVLLAPEYGIFFGSIHGGCGLAVAAILGVGRMSFSRAFSRLLRQFADPFRGSLKLVVAKGIGWCMFALVIVLNTLLRASIKILDPNHPSEANTPSSLANLSEETRQGLLNLCGTLYVLLGCVSFVCINGLMAILYFEECGRQRQDAANVNITANNKQQGKRARRCSAMLAESEDEGDVVVRHANALITALQCCLGFAVVLLTAVNSQVSSLGNLLPFGVALSSTRVEEYMSSLASVTLEALGHILPTDIVTHLAQWSRYVNHETGFVNETISLVQSAGVLEAMLTIQALFAASMLVAPPLTHFVGSVIHNRSEYDLWQPFKGSRSFIVFQALGWMLYSVGFLAGITFLISTDDMPSATTTTTTSSWENVVSLSVLALSLVMSQVCIHISVKVYAAPPSPVDSPNSSPDTPQIGPTPSFPVSSDIGSTSSSEAQGKAAQDLNASLSPLRSQGTITASVLMLSSVVPRVVCDVPWINNHPTLCPLLLLVALTLWTASIIIAQNCSRHPSNRRSTLLLRRAKGRADIILRYSGANDDDDADEESGSDADDEEPRSFMEGLSVTFARAAFHGSGEYVALQAVGWTLFGVYLLMEASALAPLLLMPRIVHSTAEGGSLKAILGGSMFPNVVSSILSTVPFGMLMVSQIIQVRYDRIKQEEQDARDIHDLNADHVENKILMDNDNWCRNRRRVVPTEKEIADMERILEVTMGTTDTADSAVVTHLALTIRRMRSLLDEVTNNKDARERGKMPAVLSRAEKLKRAKMSSVAAVFAFSLAISTFVLYTLASQNSLQPSRKPIALVFSVAAWIGTSFSVGITHVAFGRACNGSPFKPFMPFFGGPAFVVLQACGWGAYGACSLLVALFCLEVSVTTSALISAGILSVASQFFIFLSIARFVPRRPIGENGADGGAPSILEEHAEGAVSILIFLSAFTLSHCYETLGFGTLGALPVFVSLTSVCLALPLSLIAVRKSQRRSPSTNKNKKSVTLDNDSLVELLDSNSISSSEINGSSLPTLELPASHRYLMSNLLVGVETLFLLVSATLPLLVMYYVYFSFHSIGSGLLLTFASSQTVMVWASLTLATVLLLSSAERVSGVISRTMACLFFSVPAILASVAFLPPLIWPTTGTITMALGFLLITLTPVFVRKFVLVPLLFMVTGLTWYQRLSQLFWFSYDNFDGLSMAFNLTRTTDCVANVTTTTSLGSAANLSASSATEQGLAEWVLLMWFTFSHCVAVTYRNFFSLLTELEFIYGVLDLSLTAAWAWYTTTLGGAPDITGARRLPWLIDILEVHVFSYMQQFFSTRVIRDDVAALENSIDVNASMENMEKDTGVFPPSIIGFHPHGIFPVTAQWTISSDLWREVALGCHWPRWRDARAAVREEMDRGAIPSAASTSPSGTGWEDIVAERLRPDLDLNNSILKGVTTHGADIIFKGPLLRDFGMSLGMRNVSRKAIETSIQQGYSPLIVVGGQSEMIHSRITDKELHIVTYHAGFARLALHYKRPLIPILSLGEHNILGNIYWPKVQSWFLKRVGFGFPVLPMGWLGLPLPRRVPLTVVVGSPIYPDPAKTDHENPEHVEAFAELYFSQLRRLFFRHREDSGFPDMQLYYHMDKKRPMVGTPQEEGNPSTTTTTIQNARPTTSNNGNGTKKSKLKKTTEK